jgi:protein-S-isoprenylcysteine O-methyltransferase Ste14
MGLGRGAHPDPRHLATAERWARRGGATVALVAAVLMAPGVAASAGDGGRTVGRQNLSPLRLALVAAGWFAAAAVLWRPVPLRFNAATRWGLLLVAAPACAIGFAGIISGRLALGSSYRVSSGAGVTLARGHRLVVTGPFAIIRHPMYAGLVLASLGALLLYRTWATLFFVVQLPTLVARARLEEKALAAEFGPAWEAYRARVPGWMPHLGR